MVACGWRVVKLLSKMLNRHPSDHPIEPLTANSTAADEDDEEAAFEDLESEGRTTSESALTYSLTAATTDCGVNGDDEDVVAVADGIAAPLVLDAVADDDEEDEEEEEEVAT